MLLRRALALLAVLLLALAGHGSALASSGPAAAPSASLEANGPKLPHALARVMDPRPGRAGGGSLVLPIGAPTASREPADRPSVRPQLRWGLELSFYLAVLGGVGAAFFRAWIGAAGSPRGLMAVLVLAFLILVASLGVQGLELLGQGWRALLGLAPWEAAAVTRYGLRVGLAASAILLAAASLSEPRPVWLRVQTGLAVALSAAALAATGVAATAPAHWLIRATLLVHVAAVTIWAGAMVPLLVLTGRGPGLALPALKRFSTWALWSVLLLVPAGFALAFVRLGSVDALIRTAYGHLLVAKVLVAAALLLLAALGSPSLRPGAARGGAEGLRRLRLSLGLEVALVTVLAGLVAGWHVTPPPRDLPQMGALARDAGPPGPH